MPSRTARLLAAALALACLALLAPSSSYAQAQGTTTGAAVPSCAGYLNSTSTSTSPPAEACCGPLRDAAANQTACMCAMLLNKAALRAFGVAPEQGLLLARRCNVTIDASSDPPASMSVHVHVERHDLDLISMDGVELLDSNHMIDVAEPEYMMIDGDLIIFLSGASSGGSSAASSASTGSAAAASSSSVAKPTANGGIVARRLSLTGASSLVVGFSFIWWMLMA